jgi:O-6-methylguanine DNA methyltransferase
MTFFAVKVYGIVRKIPVGQVLTYKQVAILAGSPNAYRAVGNILNKNHNPKIPCHRVIRSDGKTGGYNGGTDKKRQVLKKEGYLK